MPYGHRKAAVDHMLGKRPRKASQTLDRQHEELCKKRLYQPQPCSPGFSAFELNVETADKLECIAQKGRKVCLAKWCQSTCFIEVNCEISMQPM